MARIVSGIDPRDLKHLRRAVEELGPAARKPVRQSLRRSAKRVQQTASQLAPRSSGARQTRGRDGRFRTLRDQRPLRQRLHRNFQVRAIRRTRTAIGSVVQTAPRERYGIPPDAKGFYPVHQELGTRFHEAQPSLRPAFEQNRDQVERETIRTLEHAVIDHARRSSG